MLFTWSCSMFNLSQITNRSPTGKLVLSQPMIQVYIHLCLALVTSSIVSFFVGNSVTLMNLLLDDITKWAVALSPIVMLFAIVPLFRTSKSPIVIFTMLHTYAALMGLSMSSLFAGYNLPAVVTAFMGMSILFVCISGYALVTDRDLTGIGAYIIPALIGLIIVIILNMLLGNALPDTVISVLSIVVFIIIIASDTQAARDILTDDPTTVNIAFATLTLYLSTINIFFRFFNINKPRD